MPAPSGRPRAVAAQPEHHRRDAFLQLPDAPADGARDFAAFHEPQRAAGLSPLVHDAAGVARLSH